VLTHTKSHPPTSDQRLSREEFVTNNRLAHVVLTTIRSTVPDRVFLSLLRNSIFVSSQKARHSVASYGISETGMTEV
jgi:hypothetical protein